jgi:16S rRNA (cytosine967-C5)-methyltransferase
LAKTAKISSARVAAFDILMKIEDGAFSSVLLAAKEPQLNHADRALCHELVMGVLRWQLQLDRLIEHLAKRKVESLDLPVLLALRLGLYQLRFLSRVPPSAAVNESVNLVGLARLGSAKAFVNAILRRASRELDYDPASDVEDEIQRLAIQTSHPEWLIQRWIQAFGLEETKAFARSNNELPPTAIRVLRSHADESTVLDRLTNAGAVVQPSRLTANAWRVKGAISLVRELAAKGEIYVQDEASQLVAANVGAKTSDRVLDLCAAPGGKTTQIADSTRSKALIVAGDLSLSRLRVLRDRVDTQGVDGVHPINLNATSDLPFNDNSFDCVLVDAPCSGTGTLRRNPEIRWRLKLEDIEILSRRQKKILGNAIRVLRPSGRLVYSTCSVEPEENELVVDEFLRLNTNLRRATVNTLSGSSSLAIRTWPHQQGSDGFFIAAIEKL